MKNLYDFICESMIFEGGAAGHMLHPFELPFINNGDDLVKWFESLLDKLSNGTTQSHVKLDGVNCAIRLRDDEFVLDRLTKDELDIKGMNVNDIQTRFGGHEYKYDIYTIKMLNAFNSCFNKIKGNVKKLGLDRNPNLMLNLEYIPQDKGIIDTEKNIIAIHGLLEIETNEKGSRKTHEVKSDAEVLEKIALAMTKELTDIEVITQESAYIDKDIKLYNIINQDFTVNFSEINSETKSFKQWLNEYKLTERKNCSIKTVPGKRVTTQSLQVLRYIVNGGALDEMFFEKDYDKVLQNFFLYYTTLLLGQEVLNGMNSRIGRLEKQEGVVIRDFELNQTDAPVKLTGTFVLKK